MQCYHLTRLESPAGSCRTTLRRRADSLLRGGRDDGKRANHGFHEQAAVADAARGSRWRAWHCGEHALVADPCERVPAATPVNFELPIGACDCHTHIYGDPQAFPFFRRACLHAGDAHCQQRWPRCTRRCACSASSSSHRVCHGTDNSATLYGMQARGADARGVAVIDEKTPDGTLDAMGQAGVRGIRVNLTTAGIFDPAVGRQPAAQCHRARAAA